MKDPTTPSGRFVLRVPPPLHARLTESARTMGVSLNEHCVRSLAGTEADSRGALADVVAEALRQLGADLVAVAVFGSWARGEAGPSSDVDVLIAVRRSVEITRALYAPWDDAEAVIDRHPVEPHYVRMPSPDDPISGFWAEIAIEGAVVYDPDLLLARELTRIRRAIVEGTLVRRTGGGHAWWTAA